MEREREKTVYHLTWRMNQECEAHQGIFDACRSGAVIEEDEDETEEDEEDEEEAILCDSCDN